MDKHKLILPLGILIGCIILGGFYYVGVVNINKTPLVKEKETDYFSRKVACEKYIDQISNQITTYNNSQKPRVGDSNNSGYGDPINHLYLEQKEFKEMFYSPKVNSCVYLEVDRTLIKSDPNANPNEGAWGTSFEYYNLIDALSGKEVDSVLTINRSERMDSYNSDGTFAVDVYKKVDQMVDEYKK